jgi:hypothetical protein
LTAHSERNIEYKSSHGAEARHVALVDDVRDGFVIPLRSDS